MNNKYDIAVIGAGIAGVTTAWFLKKAGLNVVLIDKSSYVASGGSGAAGAFISPRIGKGGSLHELTNRAFKFAIEFYTTNFPKQFHRTGILRIPKNSDDAQKFEIYEKANHKPYQIYSRDKIKALGIDTPYSGFYFPEAGDCDAMTLSQNIAKDIDYKQLFIKDIKRVDSRWKIISDSKSIEVSSIILATGYENNLFDMRYMGVKGLWGSRGDYFSNSPMPITIHKDFTLSSNRDGVIKIGATHIRASNPCMLCNGKPLESLEKRAKELYPNLSIELKETFCGMRATSRDSFPLVGRVLNVESMLQKYPNLNKGARAKFEYLDNIFILNGLGGRGFVFAPLMAKLLSEYIVNKKELPSEINPDRLFYKWVRKVNK